MITKIEPRTEIAKDVVELAKFCELTEPQVAKMIGGIEAIVDRRITGILHGYFGWSKNEAADFYRGIKTFEIMENFKPDKSAVKNN